MAKKTNAPAPPKATETDRLVRGVHNFQDDFDPYYERLFDELADRQRPKTLFITCSDSRIDPSLLTNTRPGEIFVIRNAGNIVPEWTEDAAGGEAGTIEFAMTALPSITDVVICGHSNCGAMKGLLAMAEAGDEKPDSAVGRWLAPLKESVLPEVEAAQAAGDTRPELEIATEKNVLAQLASIQEHPAVKARTDELTFHGWVYDLGLGEVLARDEHDEFDPL